MPEHLVWFAGNRNPSITENLQFADGTAVDLTGKTVKLKVREVGSSQLLVDAAATPVGDPTLGNVRYDWTANDIDPAHLAGVGGALSKERTLLVWWEVTTTSGGRTQDYGEAVIHVEAHAPDGQAYLEVAEFKKTIELDRNFSDLDIRSALVAASRAIDELCHRRPGGFLPASADSTRYYSTRRTLPVEIDELTALTELAMDPEGDGSFGALWTPNTDFTLEPLNAAADGRPFERIRFHPRSGEVGWPHGYPRTIRVTGRFGWPAVPEAVKTGTKMVANRLFRVVREAPFGVVALGLEGQAVRIARSDPMLELALKSVERRQVLA